MAANNILVFGATASNELTLAEYTAEPQRSTGNQPGIAKSKLNNKALHQLSVIAAGVGQFMADRQSVDVGDTLTPAQIAAMLGTAILGRYIGTQRLTASGTYTRSAGATLGVIEMVGGGAGGVASATTTASQVSAGVGGGSGAYLKHIMALPASQAYTVGAGGTGGTGALGQAGAGGATQFGTLICAGGVASGNAFAAAPPWLTIGGMGGALPTTGNLVNLPGEQAGGAQAIALSAFVTGKGANSPFGIGGFIYGTTTVQGYPGSGYGAGGGGGISGFSTPGQQGGPGSQGVIFVHEFGGT